MAINCTTQSTHVAVGTDIDSYQWTVDPVFTIIGSSTTNTVVIESTSDVDVTGNISCVGTNIEGTDSLVASVTHAHTFVDPSVDLTSGLVAHYLLNSNADDIEGTFDGVDVGTVEYQGDQLDSLAGSVTIPNSSASSCSYWKDSGSGMTFTYTTTIPTSLATDNYSNLRMYSDTKDASFQAGLLAEGYYPKDVLPEPTTANLISHYPLTGTAEDSTGNYNGTENGSTYVDDDEFGSVSEFDGINDYIEFSTESTNIRSISIWAKLLSFPPTTATVYNSISNSTSYTTTGMFIEFSSTGTISFLARDGTNSSAMVSGVKSIDTWYLLVLSVGTDNRTISAYIDDVLVDTHLNANDFQVSINKGTIGARVASTSYYGNISVRNLKTYSSALTAQEITDIYNYEKNFRSIDIDDGLVAYYPLANNSLDNYYNGYDGTDDAGVTYDGTEATLPSGDNITFPTATGFVEAYYIEDGVFKTTTTESVLNALTDCTLSEVRKYNKSLTPEQIEVIYN